MSMRLYDDQVEKFWFLLYDEQFEKEGVTLNYKKGSFYF